VIAALTLMSNPDRGAQSVFGELLHGFFVLTAWARSWLWSCWSSPCIPAEVRTGLLSAERTAQCAIRDCRTQ
jgi:hypothetical protein